MTIPPDPIVAFFDRRSRAYDRQLALERRALRTAAALAPGLRGLRVVDLAAGTGAFAAALLARGPGPAELTAVDASPRMLERARDRLGPGVAILVADARHVPLPDGAADVVSIGYLLHLLDDGARADVLAETGRLLRPDGVVVAVVHGSPPGAWGRAYRASWRLLGRLLPGAIIGGGPMDDLTPVMTAAGFDVQESRRVAGVYWSQIVRARRPGAADRDGRSAGVHDRTVPAPPYRDLTPGRRRGPPTDRTSGAILDRVDGADPSPAIGRAPATLVTTRSTWTPDLEGAISRAPRGGSVEDWKAHAESLLSRQPCVFVRNTQISALYAALYLRRPELFKWSGLAAIASRHIRPALWPLRLGADPGDEIDLPRALGRWQALRPADADWIRQTNNGIFDDIFWAHLAYDGSEVGLAELSRAVCGTPHEHIAALFERLDHGGGLAADGDPGGLELIWEANRGILEHEQRALVQPNFDRLSCAYARAFSFAATAGFEARGLWRVTSLLTSFYFHSAPRRLRRTADGFGPPSLTCFEDRWAWIDGAIVPRFRRHESRGGRLHRALMTIVDEAEGSLATPPAAAGSAEGP